MAILPVREPLTGVAGPRDEVTIAENLAALADHYDLVLVDWGALDRYTAGPSLARGIGKCLDGLALVRNTHFTRKDRWEQVDRAVRQAGIPLLGVIQNFQRT